MRIALAGKGGSGKTTISATLARLLARTGRHVVAVDADSNPNLAAALGADLEAIPRALPTDLVSRRLDGPALRTGVDEVLDAVATQAPDGVRLLHMGMPRHADEGCMCAAHATVAALLDDLGGRAATVTVVDLEASPEHLSRGTARHVDALLIVAEPYYRSLETVRRMAVLAAELAIPTIAVVANKLRSTDDTAAVEEFCERHGLRLAGRVPWDASVMDADRGRVPLIDAGTAPAVVAAVERLASALVATPAETS